MKNLTPILCSIILLGTVVGLKTFRGGSSKPNIVFFGNVVHPYFSDVQKGAEEFARERQTKVECTIGQEFTQENQNANIESLSTQGFRGFAMYPADPAGANGLFKMLRDRNQWVVVYGAEPNLPTPASFTVATDIKAAAGAAAEELIRLMGDRGSILNLLESTTDVNTRKRNEAIEAVVAKHPNVKIIQTLTDMMQLGEATNKLQSALAARGEQIDAIIATGYNPTVAAANVLTEWHKDASRKRVRFIGIDTDARVLQAIRDGSIDATIAQNPRGHGYISCQILSLLCDGWTPKEPYAFIDSGLVIVNKQTIDTFSRTVDQNTLKIVGELKTRYLLPPK